MPAPFAGSRARSTLRHAVGSASAASFPRRSGDLRAFTLVEVILALVVLGAALAVFGEVMQLANRNAVDARGETQAQLLAQSLMDEILAGVVADTPATRQPLDIEDDTPWVYSVALESTDVEGVARLEVLVEQDVEPQFNPVEYRLVRWISTADSTEGDDAGADAQPAGGQGGQTAGGTAPAGGAGRGGGTL